MDKFNFEKKLRPKLVKIVTSLGGLAKYLRVLKLF